MGVHVKNIYLLGIIAVLFSITANASSGTVTFIRNIYSSTNITTSAYVTLVASMPGTATELEIFDSSGQTLKIATGSSCTSLTDKFIIIPGGNPQKGLSIPAGWCVAAKALSGTASSGELDINFLN